MEPEEDDPKEMNPHIPGNIERLVNINAQINQRCAAGLWSGSISDLGEFALCCGRRCGVQEKFNERGLNSTIALWEVVPQCVGRGSERSSSGFGYCPVRGSFEDMRDLMKVSAVRFARNARSGS